MRLMAWLNARAMRQMLAGLRAVPNWGRVPERVYGGLEAGIVNVNGVDSGRGAVRCVVRRLR